MLVLGSAVMAQTINRNQVSVAHFQEDDSAILDGRYFASLVRGETRNFTEIPLASTLLTYSNFSSRLIQKPEFISYSVNAAYYRSASSGFGYNIYTDITLSAGTDAQAGNHVVKILFNFGSDPGGTFLRSDTLTINLTIYEENLQWDLVLARDNADYYDCMAVEGPNIFLGHNRDSASGKSGKILFSNDDGANWATVEISSTVKIVRAVSVKNGIIYAGTDAGVFVSSDSVVSWTRINQGMSDYSARGFVWLGSDLFAYTESGGVYRLISGSTAWTPVNNGFTSLYLKSMGVMNGTLFAGTQAGVFTSSDRGDTWSKANTGLPTDATATSFAAIGTTIFAGFSSYKGVYFSSNNGLEWTKAGTGFVSSDIRALAVRGTSLFAGGAPGISLSLDYGATWGPVYNSSITSSTVALAVNRNYLFVDTYNNGIFRLRLSQLLLTEIMTPPLADPPLYTLEQNYPNPFNASTTFRFTLTKSALVTVSIYDVLGRQVDQLVSERMAPGIYSTRWDAQKFAAGIYFCRLQADQHIEPRRILLLK